MPYKLYGLGVLAFFLGSIPFSLIVTKIKGVDLRSIGSGNLGATNVYRALGFKYAFGVFFLDALKGYIPVHLILSVSDQPILHVVIGFIAVLGHSLSPFVGFKGGKGAATGLGVLCGLSPHVFGIVFVIAAISIYLTRMVAPTSMACSILVPILLKVFNYPTPYIAVTALLAVFIIYRHRSNIKRLIEGKENKV